MFVLNERAEKAAVPSTGDATAPPAGGTGEVRTAAGETGALRSGNHPAPSVRTRIGDGWMDRRTDSALGTPILSKL